MKRALIILLTVAFISAFGQNQKNIWYFGQQSGIDFNSGVATAITNSSMNSFEASSVMSDTAGNLMFYTNGGPFVNYNFSGGVWNRDHNLMPNGDLDSVNTCSSAGMGTLIVPNPKNKDLFYIFATDCIENNQVGGLRYHTVDMTLDSGRGDVVLKNVPLSGIVAEPILGVKHANLQDYWVIVCDFDKDSILAYQVTANGIQSPVMSAAGFFVQRSVSQFSINSDASLISFSSIYNTYLYSFDNATGVLSNPLTLGIASSGCAFSPNDQFLYTTKYGHNQSVYQFELNAANIPASAVLVGSISNLAWAGYTLLAPDGKIYTATNSSVLHVINQPNVAGVGCNYQNLAFQLASGTENTGLPNFVFGYIDQWCDKYDTLSVIDTNSFISPSGNYVWDTSGIYQDTVTNQQGCDSILNIELIIVMDTSVTDTTITDTTINDSTNTYIPENDLQHLAIYPNPTQGTFVVDLGHKLSEEVVLSIADVYGHSQQIKIHQDHTEVSLLADKPSGMYFVTVRSGQQVKTVRLVKF